MPKTLHERLIDSLEAQSCAGDLLYLIKALKKTQITNHAAAAVLLFTVIYSHPELMDDPNAKPLRKLCQDCYLQATPNQLHNLLNKPKNRNIKNHFDRFVNLLAEEEAKAEPRLTFRAKK